MAGIICDVCGKDDLDTFVCSCSLGAASFAYCGVCSAMGAEPRAVVEGTVGIAGGLEHIHENCQLTYYDQSSDSYIDMREGPQNIKLKDGTEVKTRSEVIKLI